MLGKASTLMLILLSIVILTLTISVQLVKSEPTTWIVDDDGPADFDTIQQAIDSASPGDTIFVNNGVYVERIRINKTLRVLGQSRDRVIITHNESYKNTVYIVAENVSFSRFTILGNRSHPSGGPGYPIGPSGIAVRASFATLVYNKIVSCVWGMMTYYDSCNINISYNVFVDNSPGFNLAGNRNVVSNNKFYDNDYSIILAYYGPGPGLYECKIVGNVFYNNFLGVISPSYSGYGEDNVIAGNVFAGRGIENYGQIRNTSIYHNSFMHESHHVKCYGDPEIYRDWRFDNGYPDGGNYWSSYSGKDSCSGPQQNETGIDGIGDTPHVFNGEWIKNLTDNYPLMHPYGSIRNLNTGKNYFTIQSAVNDTETSTGHTIQIQSGTYHENVVTSKSLSLIGESKDTTILDGNWTSEPILQIESDNVTVRGITIQNSSTAGISITMSNHTKIVDTTIIDNQYGINLKNSTNTIITRNTLNRNDVGIQFSDDPGNNAIHHNTFTNNSLQISFINSSSTNLWDNGCEGNYWSNYNGTDTSIPPDGIGDTPLIIDENNTDRYPLMNPYWNPTDINHDLKVDIKDLGTAALAFGSSPGHPKWNPHADITGPEYLTPDDKVDIRDIALIAVNYGEEHS